jgi:hypothetical protein
VICDSSSSRPQARASERSRDRPATIGGRKDHKAHNGGREDVVRYDCRVCYCQGTRYARLQQTLLLVTNSRGLCRGGAPHRAPTRLPRCRKRGRGLGLGRRDGNSRSYLQPAPSFLPPSPPLPHYRPVAPASSFSPPLPFPSPYRPARDLTPTHTPQPPSLSPTTTKLVRSACKRRLTRSTRPRKRRGWRGSSHRPERRVWRSLTCASIWAIGLVGGVRYALLAALEDQSKGPLMVRCLAQR